MPRRPGRAQCGPTDPEVSFQNRSNRPQWLAGLIVAASAGLLVLTVQPTQAATLTWTGAVSMDWNETDSNWGGPLWNSATPDSAIFGATGVGVVTLTTNLTANTITFNAAGYTIAGNTLSLGGTTPTFVNNADASVSSVLAGTAGLNKSGSGTLTLSGANTFTGNINLGAGNLRITQAAGLGAGAKTMTIAASLTKMLELDGSDGDIFLPDTIDFTTSGISGVVRNLAGDNTIAGSFTMTLGNGNTKIISDGGSLKLTGNITASTGGRALDLSGSSTGDNLFSGVLDNANTPAVLKTGTGTWSMSGVNTYAGATTINAGKLVMATSGACSNSAVSLAATAGNAATLGVSTVNAARPVGLREPYRQQRRHPVRSGVQLCWRRSQPDGGPAESPRRRHLHHPAGVDRQSGRQPRRHPRNPISPDSVDECLRSDADQCDRVKRAPCHGPSAGVGQHALSGH